VETRGPVPWARRARAIAFYIPRFYPSPENDRWWGTGLTEWTGVARARSLFDGQFQPQRPGELGPYDLRQAEIRQRQVDLAHEHGIEGFCYWHYWSAGKRLFSRPFAEVLRSGRPDFSFCLSWSNETMERRATATGDPPDVLQEQRYSPDDDLEHIRWLAEAFGDPRYLQVRGRPLFLVYRPFDLPDPLRTTGTFRNECIRLGLPEPYLVGINAHHPERDSRPLGFDISLNFQPQFSSVPGVRERGLKIADYRRMARRMRTQPPDYPYLHSALVGWDDTPRQGEDGIVFINSTPDAFADELQAVFQEVQSKPFDERLVFLNAWNDWAGGSHLEPDVRYGRHWLEAVDAALSLSG
jgi:lipopolysaccharide biosynthesis protein